MMFEPIVNGLLKGKNIFLHLSRQIFVHNIYIYIERERERDAKWEFKKKNCVYYTQIILHDQKNNRNRYFKLWFTFFF